MVSSIKMTLEMKVDFLADTNFLIYLLEGRPETELFADF